MEQICSRFSLILNQLKNKGKVYKNRILVKTLYNCFVVILHEQRMLTSSRVENFRYSTLRWRTESTFKFILGSFKYCKLKNKNITQVWVQWKYNFKNLFFILNVYDTYSTLLSLKILHVIACHWCGKLTFGYASSLYNGLVIHRKHINLNYHFESYHNLTVIPLYNFSS